MIIEERFWRDLGIEQSPKALTDGNQARLGRGARMGSEEGDLSFAERHYRHVNLIATYFERDATRAATTYSTDIINAVKNARKLRELCRQRKAAKGKVQGVGSLGINSR